MLELDRRKVLKLAGMQLLAAALPSPMANASGVVSVDRMPPQVRLRGCNIVCTANPFGQPWSTYGPSVWAAMWAAWDWDNWIRPQIDDAAAIGNSVRLWGSTQCFLTGNITEDTYFARWQQMLDYCESKSLYMVAAGSDLLPTFDVTLSPGQAASHYANWADMLSGYPTVLGIDLMNEAWVLNRDRSEWVLPVLRACADAVHTRGMPVTVSFAIFNTNLWSWNPNGGGPMASLYQQCPVEPFFDLTDYLDFHIYDTTTTDQVAATYDNPWAAGKPMMFGEFGIDADHPPAVQAKFFNMVQRLVASDPANLGAIVWSCYDVNPIGNKYGLYSSPGVLRTASATPFGEFPTSR